VGARCVGPTTKVSISLTGSHRHTVTVDRSRGYPRGRGWCNRRSVGKFHPLRSFQNEGMVQRYRVYQEANEALDAGQKYSRFQLLLQFVRERTQLTRLIAALTAFATQPLRHASCIRYHSRAAPSIDAIHEESVTRCAGIFVPSRPCLSL
jgi:hypothetical protein